MKNYLLRHANKYPYAGYQDFIKLIHQSEFAGGHMISDIKSCNDYLYYEYDLLDKLPALTKLSVLYEYLSDNIVRVNLYPFKYHKLDLNELLNSFIKSANNNHGSKENYQNKIKLLDELIISKHIDIKRPNNFNSDNIYSHTRSYKCFYHPSYRVIESLLITDEMKAIKLLNYIDLIIQKNNRPIIAIEGKCAAGKSTYSKMIKDKYNAYIFHMDDFFLTEKEKTVERLQEIGGNIAYERFVSILKMLKQNKPFEYQKYCCSNKKFISEYFNNTADLIIVEGVYSYHKTFQEYYNGLIYIHIDPLIQIERLKKRSLDLLERFINEWIPLENKYFEHTNVILKADILI